MAQQELASRAAGGRARARRVTLALAWSAAAALTPLAAGAQQPVTKDGAAAAADSQAVLAVVNRMFDGMRARDTAAVRSVFAPGAPMLTASFGPDGAPRLNSGQLDAFITALGQPSDRMWDERLFDTHVRVDGNLASVWTGYNFFAGDQFSHCGVNHFTLARHPDGQWRVVHLADTRRREGCEPQRTGK